MCRSTLIASEPASEHQCDTLKYRVALTSFPPPQSETWLCALSRRASLSSGRRLCPGLLLGKGRLSVERMVFSCTLRTTLVSGISLYRVLCVDVLIPTNVKTVLHLFSRAECMLHTSMRNMSTAWPSPKQGLFCFISREKFTTGHCLCNTSFVLLPGTIFGDNAEITMHAALSHAHACVNINVCMYIYSCLACRGDRQPQG